MSSPPTVDASNEQGQLPVSGRHRFSRLAAYLAAPLWALQAVIWLAAPKVQEAAAPFTITRPLLFVLFWLSIAGAVAFSAASAAEIPRVIQGFGSRVSRWAKVLATIGCPSPPPRPSRSWRRSFRAFRWWPSAS